MRRKIIKQGTSTLTVSLPAEWTKKYKLKAGDELVFTESQNTLVLSSDGTTKTKQTTIDMSALHARMVKSHLYSLYITGHDMVTITYGSKEQYAELTSLANNLIGFEIVAEQGNTLTIKDFTAGHTEDFSQLLRRIFLLIMGFIEDGHTLLVENRIDDARELSKRDHTINKFVAYCLRILNKKGHPDYENTALYYTVISIIESLADEFARIFYYIEGPVHKKTCASYKEVGDLCRQLYESFYQFESSKAYDLMSWRNTLRTKLARQMSRDHVEDTKVLYRLTKIAEHAADIIKMRISLAL